MTANDLTAATTITLIPVTYPATGTSTIQFVPSELGTAPVPETVGGVTGSVFRAGDDYKVFLAPIGVFTGDDRIIFDLAWRDGRLPFTFSDSEMSHGDAVHVGNLENLAYEELDGVTWVVAEIDWDTDDTALEAQRMVNEDRIRGVSIHLGSGWSVLFCRDEMSDTPTREEVIAAAEDLDVEECTRWAQGIFEAEVAAATMVLIPAFEEAHVEPVLAAAQELADLMAPPREWFDDPLLESPSGIRISRDGRVTGHVAFWDACHRGFPGECVVPPRGSTGYSEFHKNAVLTFDDLPDGSVEEFGVGCLTLDVNHANTTVNLQTARNHYDHSGTVFAFVRAGEDEHGVWVSGALAPGLDAEKVEVARRMRLSGDWRPTNGSYELIAAQSVPVPGFVPRSLVADGQQVLLSTVGPAARVLEDEPTDMLLASAMIHLGGRIQALTVMLRPLADEAARRELSALFDPTDETL